MTTIGPETQTTDAGIPVESDAYSLTVGRDGPILLQDSYLIEQMAQFNRERVPERQPHAKGSGAFGRFEQTDEVVVAQGFHAQAVARAKSPIARDVSMTPDSALSR